MNKMFMCFCCFVPFRWDAGDGGAFVRFIIIIHFVIIISDEKKKLMMITHTHKLCAQIRCELNSISITEMQTPNGINSTLSIAYSDRQDSGVYKCVAENAFGKSEYIIYVAVQGM